MRRVIIACVCDSSDSFAMQSIIRTAQPTRLHSHTCIAVAQGIRKAGRTTRPGLNPCDSAQAAHDCVTSAITAAIVVWSSIISTAHMGAIDNVSRSVFAACPCHDVARAGHVHVGGRSNQDRGDECGVGGEPLGRGKAGGHSCADIGAVARCLRVAHSPMGGHCDPIACPWCRDGYLQFTLAPTYLE